VAALEPERVRLEALRLTALEDQVEAELALGGHAALVGSWRDYWPSSRSGSGCGAS
jgi:hypothetical protein